MIAIGVPTVMGVFDRVRVLPFVSLDVAVGKSQHTGILVLDRRAMKEQAGRAHENSEARKADVYWRSINESEDLGRIHCTDVGAFAKSVKVCVRRVAAEVPRDVAVERIVAEPRQFLAAAVDGRP